MDLHAILTTRVCNLLTNLVRIYICRTYVEHFKSSCPLSLLWDWIFIIFGWSDLCVIHGTLVIKDQNNICSPAAESYMDYLICQKTLGYQRWRALAHICTCLHQWCQCRFKTPFQLPSIVQHFSCFGVLYGEKNTGKK